jgi:hypothetical protein
MKSVKKTKPRIDLSPLMHRLLIAEAAKRGIRPNALVEKLIEEASSPEAKALVGMKLEDLEGIKNEAQVESAPSPLVREEPQKKEERNPPLAPSSGSLSAEEELVLQHLRLKTPYRKIETITGVSKSKVQTIAAKLEGMGLHQRRKPPKDKV